MQDPTEQYRRERTAELNSAASLRERLEKLYGKVWDTEQLSAEFEVIGFMAPFCVVKNKATGKKGSMEFQHYPRYYFNYYPDPPARDYEPR